MKVEKSILNLTACVTVCAMAVLMEEICEVCGKRKARFKVNIEGAILLACGKCATLGKVISEIRVSPVRVPYSPESDLMHVLPEPEEELVEVCGAVINRPA